MRRVVPLIVALAWMALTAPDVLGANRATFTDKGGDACCTEDIRRVVVSNDDAGTITFAVTAPLQPAHGSASDRFIKITTARGLFLIGTNPDGEGYVLSRGAAKVLLGRVQASARGDVFRFVIDRHRLGDTDRFSFGVAFWSVTSFGANVDAAPDAGKWSYEVKLALGGVRPVLGVRQHGVGGSRLSAGLALHLGRSHQLLASGTISCSASVGRRRLRVLRQAFVGRHAVCVWEVPKWARGHVVHGVIVVRITQHQGSPKRRSFRRLVT